MTDSLTPKRTYHSARRQEQARQTRRQILAAAQKLFLQRGYHPTSIEAIAKEAGVAPETVYAAFGNKLALLSGLVDISIVGDDQPIPLLQRQNILAANQEKDPHHLLQTFAINIYDIMNRMSPIFLLLRAAEKTDPDIAALLQKLLKDRLQGMLFVVEQLDRLGPLRQGLNRSQAAETVWAVSSGEVFHLLTVDRGWSREQYVHWLVDTLARILLKD
jgi:TetR/AcrR family transcriptional regulator of autoinduction and epiphytic fitness